MNDVDIKFFDALTKHRARCADVLEETCMSGIQNSVVEKYTDQAHFIYELLQNADDAGATSVEFVLQQDCLVFKHNGTRHFFVTDPAKEAEDTKNGKLGDLNAITSVANSNKQKASIGKFGVGFKAVFQYTQTPHIFDPDFQFRIERFIVPVLLENDWPGRKKDETIFVFPFDHKERLPEEAYDDISEKLRNLTYPILFLNKLQNISFEIDSVIGLYEKKIEKTRRYGDITADLLRLTRNEGEDIFDEYLWLFSREDENNHKYCVGYFIDENDRLKPCTMNAFCFFPTKEVTNLSFIVHAPFLLTDSREGIKAGESHNKEKIELLATLAGDSLDCLRQIGEESNKYIIDDSILDIVPIDDSVFSAMNDRSRISFLPFYHSLKKALQGGLLPTGEGYVTSEEAYWADTLDINALFTNSQLSELLGKEAKWVFCSYGRNTVSHNAREGLQKYIDSVCTGYVTEYTIYRNICRNFIVKQSEEWLHSLYRWISDVPRRFQNLKTKEMFIDSDGNAVAAYDSNDQKTLFLPSHADIDCPTVSQSLLSDEKTKNFLVDVVKLEEPSLKDYIYNKIVPEYDKEDEIDTDSHFMLFFKYFKQCPQEEVDEFIELIKDCRFVTYYDGLTGQLNRTKASDLYYPTDMLKSYFATKQDTRFVALDDYLDIVGESNRAQLDLFLSKLGVKFRITVYVRTVNLSEAINRGLPRPNSTRGHVWKENYIDGCIECIDSIVNDESVDRSLLLWQVLVGFIEKRSLSSSRLSDLLGGYCSYFYYSSHRRLYISLNVKKLREEKWLVDKEGKFVSSNEITLGQLSSQYDTESAPAKVLLDFLDLNVVSDEDDEEIANLSDKQKERIGLAKRAEELGLTIDDLETYARIKEMRELPKTDTVKDVVSFSSKGEVENASNYEGDEGQGTQSGKTSVIRDISQRTKNITTIGDFSQKSQVLEDDDCDADEYTPKRVDFSKKIEQAKQKSASEIDKIIYLEELQQRVQAEEESENKYSFLWFKSLLELETLNTNQNSLSSREVSICFSKVEQEEGSQRVLLLKYPNRYIPQFMEELADIPLVLDFGEHVKTIAIEVVNIKSYTLRVKVKANVDISSLDLHAVKEVRLDAKSPVFLLEELRKQFLALGFNDDFNMRDNLCSNIDFIFGPPGTGKTTYLAKNVLVPLMKEKDDLRVLVLTPTNKAADVLVKRITEVMQDDHTYDEWLVRFGITGDEKIEDSSIFRDKSFDIRTLKRNVTVTTIARFPYDYFMPGTERLMLQALNWDYIVIDEASMIPLVNIIYPLYKKTPRKFVIAGDPFQIEPITAVDIWKNENIFKMVQLDSFVDPKTVPYQYNITTLTMQYRSVPEVGTVFSKFAYGGILQHYRTSESKKNLNIDSILEIKPLNIIKFPVSRYESIYRCKRLQHSSSYQVYAALFTYEFAEYLARQLYEYNGDEQKYSIGIIAPYRAQADLIEKLIESSSVPSSIDIQVGTIHGFQGDECDIIIAVFNTPPTISGSSDMFLNKKNIVNVSISRPRDYLFVVMPDDETENINSLKLIKRVEQLMNDVGVQQYTSSYLEQVMFGKSSYIEENAFSTGHQNVNVYGLPEKYYEIRSEEAAVDIQIHKSKRVQGVDATLVDGGISSMLSDAIDSKSEQTEIDLVYSTKYGNGKIVKRESKDGKTFITVDFGGLIKSFDEVIAFGNRSLTCR